MESGTLPCFSFNASQIQTSKLVSPAWGDLNFFLVFFFASSVPQTQQLKFLSYAVDRRRLMPSTIGIVQRHMPSTVWQHKAAGVRKGLRQSSLVLFHIQLKLGQPRTREPHVGHT